MNRSKTITFLSGSLFGLAGLLLIQGNKSLEFELSVESTPSEALSFPPKPKNRLRHPFFERAHHRSGKPNDETPKESITRDPVNGWLENELIVILKPGTAGIDELARLLEADVTGRMDKYYAYRLEFGSPEAVAKARAYLLGNGFIESADSNFVVSRLPGEVPSYSNMAIQNLTVNLNSSGNQIIVGLVDTAVQLQGSSLNEALFLPSVYLAGEPADGSAALTHGTAMAEAMLQGIVMTQTSQTGTSVKILPVDVYGTSETTTTYQVMEGIAAAIEGGATIINLSLGTGYDSPMLRGIIETTHAQGVVYLGAAGNEPVATPYFPAAYPEVIAVTSIDQEGMIATYANYGEFVDIATPGYTLVSFNGYPYLVTGTSVSTALATGITVGLAERKQISLAQAELLIRQGLEVK